MPAHRKTRQQLELTGAVSHEAGKYAHRGDPVQGDRIGPAPAHLTCIQCSIWAEIVQASPEGTLTAADAIILELIVRLTERLRAGLLTKAAELNALTAALAKLGLSPADRAKLNIVPVTKAEESDPWVALLSK